MTVGKLTRVPLREVWKHEATGFTRWLEDNVEILNEVIDVNLAGAEREKRQESAGGFSVHLVAEDQDGETVVFENQLEASDHDHPGKLLTHVASEVSVTYSAALYAATTRPSYLRREGYTRRHEKPLSKAPSGDQAPAIRRPATISLVHVLPTPLIPRGFEPGSPPASTVWGSQPVNRRPRFEPVVLWAKKRRHEVSSPRVEIVPSDFAFANCLAPLLIQPDLESPRSP